MYNDRYLEDPWISSYPDSSYRERYEGEEDDEPYAVYDP